MNIQLPDPQENECLNQEISLPQSNLQKLSNQVKQIGKWLGKILSKQPKFIIRCHKDLTGNELWQVYDTSINRTVYLTSEEEVRVWIEECSYHRYQESQPSNSFDLYVQRRLF